MELKNDIITWEMVDPFSIDFISHTNFDLIHNVHNVQFS